MHIPNTNTDPISLREYGRNIQNLIRRITHVPDKTARTHYTKTLVPLMKIINPHLQHNTNSSEKTWQDIFSIANYTLDIDPPYPISPESSLQTKPTPLPYIQPLKYKRYGRHISTALQQIKHLDQKTQVETILLQIAEWILTFHRKHNSIEDILRYFKDIIGKDSLPDLDSIRQKLQAFAPPHQHNKNPPKRYLRKKGKPRKDTNTYRTSSPKPPTHHPVDPTRSTRKKS